MLEPAAVDWRSLIDDVLLRRLTDYAAGVPAVRTVYLTGSYVRGMWNPERPNVNVYFVVDPAHTDEVRSGLADVFSQVRAETRIRGADFLVDCHPFTISQRDQEWGSHPLLTLTTKVFDAARLPERLGVSPTIGYGWWLSHRVLHGDESSLAVFEVPPPRSEAWFRGAHAALSRYRAVLEHLPWAIDPRLHPGWFLEETCRYAEEAIKDGVHFGVTDEEVVGAGETAILHDWPAVARDFFLGRYGPDGAWAVDAVARCKAAVLACEVSPAEAMAHWRDALRVWDVVWSQYAGLARRHGMPDDLLGILSWM